MPAPRRLVDGAGVLLWTSVRACVCGVQVRMYDMRPEQRDNYFVRTYEDQGR